MAGAGAILKLPNIAGSLSGLKNSLKGLASSNWFKGALGGLGVSELGGTILIIAVVAGGLWLVFRYLDSRIQSRPRPSGSGGNGGGNRSGGKRHKKGKGSKG